MKDISYQAVLHYLSQGLMRDLGAGDFEIRLPTEQFRRMGEDISALTKYQAGGYTYPKKQITLYSYSGTITIKEI